MGSSGRVTSLQNSVPAAGAALQERHQQAEEHAVQVGVVSWQLG